MGLGLQFGLTCIGIVREFIGSGKIFNIQILPDSYEPFTIFILAPGAFFVLACLVALQNKVKNNLAAVQVKSTGSSRMRKARCCFLWKCSGMRWIATATATETVAGKDK